jgi:hypothetical protein
MLHFSNKIAPNESTQAQNASSIFGQGAHNSKEYDENRSLRPWPQVCCWKGYQNIDPLPLKQANDDLNHLEISEGKYVETENGDFDHGSG